MKSCPKAHCTYPICDCVTDENVPLLRTDQPAPTPILEIGPVFNVAVSHSGCNYLAQEDSVCDKCGRYIKPHRQLERELSALAAAYVEQRDQTLRYKAEAERLREALLYAAETFRQINEGKHDPFSFDLRSNMRSAAGLALEKTRAALAATRKEEGNG